ncbi:MAG: efflux RND transporter periplasmic adaptor subunit [Pseudomonadota bacterium]
MNVLRPQLPICFSAVAACFFVVSAEAADGPVIAVTTTTIADVVVADRRVASAEVAPRHRAILAAELTGRIVNVAVDTGDTIRKGDVLLRIDPTNYELALRRAEADLRGTEAEIERAKSRLERIEALAKRDYASDDELQVETTSLAVLEGTRERRRIERDQARVDLARTRIVAPFDGIIETRAAQLGNYVAPGTELLTVVQRDDRQIVAALHADLVASISNDPDRLRFVGPDGESAVEIARLSPVVEPVSRTQSIRLRFVGDPQRIGSLGELRWQSSTGLLPADYVMVRDGVLGVFIADGDTATFVPLPAAQPGRPADHELAPDTIIIVNGRQRLRDGDLIRRGDP